MPGFYDTIFLSRWQNWNLQVPENTSLMKLRCACHGFYGFVETLSFQQMVKHLFTEGIVPVPPNRPFALRLCRITFSGVIAPGGCDSDGCVGIICRSPEKSVKKNILRISYENGYDAEGPQAYRMKIPRTFSY